MDKPDGYKAFLQMALENASTNPVDLDTLIDWGNELSMDELTVNQFICKEVLRENSFVDILNPYGLYIWHKFVKARMLEHEREIKESNTGD